VERRRTHRIAGRATRRGRATRGGSRLARAVGLVAAACALGLPAAVRAAPPPAGTCPSLAPAPTAVAAEDAAAPRVLHEGQALGIGQLPALEKLLPPEIWRHRETFFYEGMRLEIGGCHRDYPASPAYRAATERFAGKARVDEHGNLRDYVAGRPFPAASIDSGAADAGVRWAWNFVERDRGAGPVGSFRIVDMPGRLGTTQVYTGSFFWVRTRHRADLAASDYREKVGGDAEWVAGGRFDEPFDARELAWRQMRPEKTETRYQEPDDTFVYVPTMRKVRRAATAWVDGLYAPRYLVAGVNGGGGPVPFGSTQYGPAGSIQPTAALSIAASENLRRGWVGLTLRPNAYEWKLLEEREVLAPLDANVPGYPENPDRNYGPSGLSVATDRWDVRWAVVIEGRAKQVVDDVGYVRLWIDWQTGQPLYYITERPNRLPLDVGILEHRYSGDRVDYPAWPGGDSGTVFDPVSEVFFDVGSGGAGWRRESYDAVSVPVAPERLRKMATVDELTKGR
jgi:hypothetical protein